MRVAPLLLTVALAATTVGCARYEYDLVQPPELTRHIGTKVDQVVAVEPLEYRLRTADNRLVMRVFNPTTQPIELLGPRSSVVDPQGQSHPLRSQSIAPQSFIKLIFPPLRPRLYDAGPTFGVGVGVYSGGARHRHRRFIDDPYPAAYDAPRYVAVYDEGDTYYWDWSGTGEARINLAYRQGDREFRHEFTFRRVKM
jgi:hypothetical protein